jgi:hypothetical protein
MITENIFQKVTYLESLGYVIESYSQTDTPSANVTYDDGEYYCEILFEDFEVGDSEVAIRSAANVYSCCGDILNQDYMICPTCKEHN